MLVPNGVLVFTEPYSWSTIAASLLLPGGVYLLWAMAAARPGKAILWAIPMMVFCAFQFVISYLFGGSVIAVDMFLNVFTTNVSEASELLGTIYPSIVIVIAIYVPLIVLAALSLRGGKVRLPGSVRRNGALVALCLIVAGSGLCMVSKARNSEFAVKYHIFPVNIFYNMKLASEKWNLHARYPEMSANFSFDAVKTAADTTHREIYVLVVGEASRACSWQLLGYERETTPRLSERGNVIGLTNVLTESNTTHKSVPMILSPCSAESYGQMYARKSVVSLFREAGFRTAFISNQPVNHALTDYFAADADMDINVTPHDIVGDQHYDGDLLQPLRQVIESTEGNLFVILHTYGSHANHAKRYPRELARFTPDDAPSVSPGKRAEMRNAYDNTIIYTDHVLAGVIELLDSQDASTGLLYCADHGEDVMDDSRNRYLHASPTPTYYQLHVAAMMWLSPEYRETFPVQAAAAQANANAPASTSALFHTIAGMASIETPYADPTSSLVSPQWRPRPRLYLDDYDRAVRIEQCGLDPKDFRMFDLHSIDYEKSEATRRKF